MLKKIKKKIKNFLLNKKVKYNYLQQVGILGRLTDIISLNICRQVLRDGVNQAPCDRGFEAAGRDDPRGPEDRGLQERMPFDLRMGDQRSPAE